jgi:predicted transcriptional regulator
MADETILTRVADIVSAHVSNNSVPSSDLPVLIKAVHDALACLGQVPEPGEEKLVPAVSIRSSVKPDTVTCLECGARMKMLKRHLGTDHNLTPDSYRARWNLPADYPMVAPEYADRRRALAVKIGLGRKPSQTPVPAPVPAPVAKAATPGRLRKTLGLVFGSAEPATAAKS